ncbi:hypothetical protein WG908_14965 [Sphingobium sp. AN641]|uniref:hypothetical protein n=1 Tax=Sphingobium sp. AN641 TaxID=3133443 RepID=UPI0030BAD19F
MAEMVIDEVNQIVRATHLDSAMLTVDDVKRFNADLARLVSIAAARFGRVRVLADTHRLPILPPDVSQLFDPPDRVMRAAGDRYALVVASNLAKLAARRVLGSDDRVGLFLSSEAAELWLLDDAISPEAAEAAARKA